MEVVLDQGQEKASATIGMSPSRPQLALYFAEFLSMYLLSLRIYDQTFSQFGQGSFQAHGNESCETSWTQDDILC